MQSSESLGRFLAVRRARLDPRVAGVPTLGGRRRVDGLRREELAALAGVSPSYYARLEQGHSTNASEQVLDALSRALGLDEDEHRHLHALASHGGSPTLRTPPPESASVESLDLLTAMPHVPVAVLGRRGDVLAWNPLWHALFAGHLEPDSPADPTRRPNAARMVFLDPHGRDLYVDWPAKAAAVVQHLRLVAGRHPDDAALVTLIGELATHSDDFARLWSRQGVRRCPDVGYALRHPVVGRIDVRQQSLAPTSSPDSSVVVVTVDPDSPSAAALALLR